MKNTKKRKNSENIDNHPLSLTVAKTLLAVLADITTGTIKAFFPHPYSHIFCEHAHKKLDRDSVYAGLYYLKKRGLIKVYRKNGEQNFILTHVGKKKSQPCRTTFKFADFFIGPSKHHWDGKWRILIFDIPEKLRRYRDFLRTELSSLGFYQLQKSVWVHPLPIPEAFWKEVIDPGLLSFVRIGVLESINQEAELKDYFFGGK